MKSKRIYLWDTEMELPSSSTSWTTSGNNGDTTSTVADSFVTSAT